MEEIKEPKKRIPRECPYGDKNVHGSSMRGQAVFAKTDAGKSVVFSNMDVVNALEIYLGDIRLGTDPSLGTDPARTYRIPYITLFIDDACRAKFLEMSAKSTKPKVIDLRRILSDPRLCYREMVKTVLKIAEICGDERMIQFEYPLFVSLPGEPERRIRIYLNLQGKVLGDQGYYSETTSSFDLTPIYNRVIKSATIGQKR